MGVLLMGVQANAGVVSNPLIDCSVHGDLAEKIMIYKLNGASQEKLTRAMKATQDTSPAYEIQANMGMQIIQKAFEVDAPNSKRDYKKFASDFGAQQQEQCKKATDINVPD